MDVFMFGGIVMLATLAVLIVTDFFLTRRVAKYSIRRQNAWRKFNRYPTRSGVGDSSSQLRHVMAASFYKKKVMSKAEYKVFKIVERELQAQRSNCRVLSQTSLGEIIGSDSRKAFESVNSKRVDILVIGPYGEPIAAIEYQGGSHHQGDAAARDAVKREALRRAGVDFIEVEDSHTPDEIIQFIRRSLKLDRVPYRNDASTPTGQWQRPSVLVGEPN